MPSGPDRRPSARAPVARLALASCIGIFLLSCGESAPPTTPPPTTPPPTTPLPPTSRFTIPDPGLRAAVTVALDRGAGDPVTGRDLSTLRSLTANSAQIVDLTGLEWATGLERLNLIDNEISDLLPLAGLTGLEELWLGWNNISDISPLARLTRLRHLDLRHNDIADLTPIAHLPWSEGDSLYVRNNPLRQASLDLLSRLADAGVDVDYDLPPEG